MGRPPRARAAVLAAAEAVLAERGSDAFTLDAVAARAGVSKGGLIYHFPSKEALLRGIVQRAVGAVEGSLAAAAASTEPGAFARAYLDSTVPASASASASASAFAPGGRQPEDAGRSLAALVAAVAHDPRLLDPVREAYRRWQDRLERDGLDAAAATAVRLAVDGWWLSVLLGLPPLAPDVHARTRALLEGLCRPGVRPGAASPSPA